MSAAERHGDLLVVSLGNQPGDCDDGHWKDRAWYSGGYRNMYPGNGYTVATVSYWDWVHEIVARYRNSPAIGMWELINEPEATDCGLGANVSNCYGHQICPNSIAATAAMRSFFDAIGNEIKRIDPNHLVESGVLGGAQCGWVGDGFATAQASSGIDVVSVHDYSPRNDHRSRGRGAHHAVPVPREAAAGRRARHRGIGSRRRLRKLLSAAAGAHRFEDHRDVRSRRRGCAALGLASVGFGHVHLRHRARRPGTEHTSHDARLARGWLVLHPAVRRGNGR